MGRRYRRTGAALLVVALACGGGTYVRREWIDDNGKPCYHIETKNGKGKVYAEADRCLEQDKYDTGDRWEED